MKGSLRYPIIPNEFNYVLKMKILITGFEPFNGMPSNPSQVMVNSLKDISFESNFPIEIFTEILPVNFQRSGEMIVDLIYKFNPDICIATGVDLSKQHIELEKRAHKNSKFLKSKFLKTIDNKIVKRNLPENYNTSINLEMVSDTIQPEEKNVKTIVSDNTGMFVCNHIYYLMNVLNEYSQVNFQCCFIHIPYPNPYWEGENQIIPNFTIEEIQESFLKILGSIIKQYLEDKRVDYL